MRASQVAMGACAAALLMARPVGAQELVAGWEGEPGRGYAFVAPAVTIAEEDGRALMLRSALSFLYYEIDGADAPESVRSPGAALALGLRLSGSRATLGIASGFEIRRTTRSGGAAGNRLIERGLTLQAELFAHAGDSTLIGVLGSYGHANRYAWVRAGATRTVKPRTQDSRWSAGVGLEGTMQGNADFRTLQAGAALELGVAPAASVQIRAGYARHTAGAADVSHHPYLGVGLYRRF